MRLDDLLDIATSGAKLGIATNDLVRYTEGIAKVSSAMDDIPAGEIADQIGKLNTVFKYGVDGAMQFGSAIDKLADSGASSSKDILNVTQRIAGSAVIAKLSGQETVSLAAALLDTGTQAELASGALLDFIASLNQAKGRETIARTLGMDMASFAALVEDKPMVAIQKFLGALSKLNAQGQIKTLTDMGMKGDVHPAEMMKLALVAGSLGKYVGYANHEFQTLDQITKSYNASANTTAASLAVTRNRLQILGDTIGSALLPGINTGLSLLNDLAVGLGEAFTRSAALIASWGADFSGIVELLSAGFQNMADVFERTGVMIGGAALNAWEYIAHGGEVAGATAQYLWESFKEAFQITLTAAGNLKDNMISILKEIWDYLKSGGKDPIEFKLKGLMEGIDLKGDGQFKMPAMKALSSVEDKIAEIDKRMQDRADANAQKKLDAANKAKAAPGTPGATAGTGTAATSNAKAGVTDADTYARELQEGALKGGNDTNKDILAQAIKQTELLEKIEKKNTDRQILAGVWG